MNGHSKVKGQIATTIEQNNRIGQEFEDCGPLSGRFQTVERGSGILLIDDDEDQLDLFCLLLGRRGYPISSASEAREALKIATSGSIGVIVCDIKMPEITGCELVEKMRHYPSLSCVPVILMTAAKEMEDLEVDFLAAGADMFCVKSNIQLLMSQVDFLLS